MKNNEIILAFIKENLGKDLNNDYNELGCAQTVNNILTECLGYPAGGGASTALMLKTLVANNNFKEVTTTKARAGDIIISATGTGNGTIAHGHVGFLGENGVIYSNNSYKDMLDGHITAEQWKNYFARKGGFSVRYFRAIAEPKVQWKPKATLPKLLQSSKDPNKLSLTVIGLVLTAVTHFAQQYNITITAEDLKLVQDNLLTLASVLVTIWGVVRKYIK